MARVTHKPGPGAAALRKAVDGLHGSQGKVGWFPSAVYEKGTPVALVAIVHEYGSVKRNIPPRPFMRPTQEQKVEEWKADTHKLAAAVVAGKMPPAAVMQGVTQKAEGDIRRTISKVLSPPLAERTMEARKARHSKGKASSKPLVDTGYMLNTLTSQVSKK